MPWKFNQIPKGFWNDVNNVKEYMNWLSDKLNIKTMEDWYKVSKEVKSIKYIKINYYKIKDIIENYGSSLIKHYNESIINLIKSAYPNYNWLPWKFNHAPKGFWSNENNVKEYMNWLSERLNIKTMEDWYRVTEKVNYSIKYVD